MVRRTIIAVTALWIVQATCVFADRFPPAPDDLFDPDLIELDLDAIVAEKEKLWSLSLTGGFNQSDLATTLRTTDAIASIEAMFQAVNEQFGSVQDLGWSGNGFSDLTNAYAVSMSGRVKFPEAVVLPGLGSRMGLELTGSRIGSSTRMGENAFGAVITDQVLSLDLTALFYLPKETFQRRILFLGSRRDLFFGLGGGLARGTHQMELFLPPRDFGSIPPPTLLSANQTAGSFHIKVGGEEYYTSFLSLSWVAGFQSLLLDQLEWNSSANSQFAASDETGTPILTGWNQTGGVATVWDDWFPATALTGSWVARPGDPIEIDFSGFLFGAGLRYHF